MGAYFTTSISRGGQITLPADVRRHLGVEIGDRVSLEIVGGEVKVAPAQSIVARLAGSTPLPHRDEDGDYDERIEEAVEEHVGEEIEKLNRR